MDYLKEAFKRVKEDIFFLKEEIESFKKDIHENKEKINQFSDILEIVQQMNLKLDKLNFVKESPTDIPTDSTDIPTDSTDIPTDSTDIQHKKQLLKPLEGNYSTISIGNRGVSTDRQTDTSTDRQTQISNNFKEKSISNAIKFLDSLDSLKKEIRLKFKRLTDQEFLVFSTIYQMEEENKEVDYRTLSKKLNLTESSIRDYVGRLLKKEIPIEKCKINNKNIKLFVSGDLKKIVSLSTIFQLREI